MQQVETCSPFSGEGADMDHATAAGRSVACLRWMMLVLLIMVGLGSCPPVAAAAPASQVAAGTPSAPNPITTVVLIVLENHDWSTIKGNASAPYLNRLLTRPDVAYASNDHNVPTVTSLHPSEGTYLWLEAGTNVFPDRTFTVDQSPSAANSTASTAHLVTLLQAKGIAWRAYQED